MTASGNNDVEQNKKTTDKQKVTGRVQQNRAWLYNTKSLNHTQRLSPFQINYDRWLLQLIFQINTSHDNTIYLVNSPLRYDYNLNAPRNPQTKIPLILMALEKIWTKKL